MSRRHFAEGNLQSAKGLIYWWVHQDSNLGPADQESAVLAIPKE